MKHTSFTAMLALFLLVGCALPTTINAQTAKCSRAIRKAEKKCHCTLQAIPKSGSTSGEKRHKEKKRRGFYSNGTKTGTRRPGGGYTFTSTTVEDGDTTSTIAFVHPNWDTTFTELTNSDTTDRWESSYVSPTPSPSPDSSSTVEKTPDSTGRDGTWNPDDTTWFKIELKKKPNESSGKMEFGYIGTPPKTFYRETSDSTNAPPYIVWIFENHTGITSIEVAKEVVGKINGKDHFNYWLVVKGDYDYWQTFTELVKIYGRLKNEAPKG